MSHRRGPWRAPWALSLILLLPIGCEIPGPAPDSATSADLAAPDLGGDLLSDDTPAILPGAAGAACADPSDCFRLKQPLCFYKSLFNVGITLPTPGGYCSARCEVDRDCGPNGKCFEFDLYGKFCFAGCDRATVCRHPGYVCPLDFQICWPDVQFDCDPTQGDASCQARVDPDPMAPPLPGGCLRETHEDRGRCVPTCQIGVNSCPIDLISRQTRHCVYLDATTNLKLEPTRDRWRGLICIPDGVPVLDGKPCSFFEDCFDGSQCDLWPGGDGRCHPLCTQDGMIGCPMGTSCRDVLRAGTGGPGLCK